MEFRRDSPKLGSLKEFPGQKWGFKKLYKVHSVAQTRITEGNAGKDFQGHKLEILKGIFIWLLYLQTRTL